MDIKSLLKMMIDRNGSDLFYRVGARPRIKIDGKVMSVEERSLTLTDLQHANEFLMNPDQRERFNSTLDIDFAFYDPELKRRFRVNIFMQRNEPSIVIRNINTYMKSFEELNLPAAIFKRLAMETRGLVLLTGSMGSGKSTTIASMIEHINLNCKKHILTVEEPIEFTFEDKESLINQRELGLDVSSYAVALRAFTLQSPDVMFISNIRDQETMMAALTAAETGVLVLSTIHSVNASPSTRGSSRSHPRLPAPEPAPARRS